ncbi:GGDEF domain-containing protein [Algirhabdus cladophorae]|uniref:GGDEF domain-containing protein n=1 Tax=Algirhabdus cladophorae TaxID=3377108 RepID=UPI003B84B60C
MFEGAMKLRSSVGVHGFALSIGLLSLVVAQVLNIAVFDPEILPQTMRGTTIITICVSVPICYFVGSKIRQNTLLSDELERIVNRDRLTDVATRDYFFDRMNAAPEAYGVSLMIDIDHFKNVNDTYGHIAGDKVIREVADVLKENTRSKDIVCRFGGEEFVIFLDEAGLAEGHEVAEQIRSNVQANTTPSEGDNIKVTVSIGGSLKDAARDLDESIKLADAALYRAKEAGRNQTVFPPRADRRENATGAYS